MCDRVQKGDTIVEIGPGKGVLTAKLLEKGAIVTAIETDPLLIPILKETFAENIKNESLTLVHSDILEWKIPTTLGEYSVVANIPYYITGAILRTFLEHTDNNPQNMTLLVQKEIADRVIERDGKASILSLSVRAYGTVKKLMNVRKEAFSPPPKVTSAILEVSNISKDFFTTNNISEKDYFTIVRGAFGQKRKTTTNNLSRILPEIDWKGIFSEHSLPLNIRSEEISLEKWIILTERSTKRKK